MTGRRVVAAAVTIAGVGLAVVSLWRSMLPLALVGAGVAGLGASSWSSTRRGAVDREQEAVIRHLWRTARRLPTDRILIDPDTGVRITVERARGFLTLAVADPAQAEDAAERETVVTRYMLGFGRRPLPPPLHRHLMPIHDVAAGPMSWRQTHEALRLAEATGAADANLNELTELRDRLDRAVAADDAGGGE